MKKHTIAAQLLLGVCLGLVVLSVGHACVAPLVFRTGTAEIATQPLAVVEPASWNFGTVEPGKSLEARIEVRNDGGRRLVLRRLKGGCDCLSSAEDQVLVEPGAKRTIAAQFNTSGMNGACRFEIAYRTNDPRRPHLRFVCTAKVRER